jgi:hypothetical protein
MKPQIDIDALFEKINQKNNEIINLKRTSDNYNPDFVDGQQDIIGFVCTILQEERDKQNLKPKKNCFAGFFNVAFIILNLWSLGGGLAFTLLPIIDLPIKPLVGLCVVFTAIMFFILTHLYEGKK